MATRGWLLGSAAVFAVLLCAVSMAGAPAQNTQAPGYYRMRLGAFEVTALSDGTFPMKAAELLTNVTAKERDAALARAFLKDPLEGSVNGFLVNTGAKLVLIDTGSGTNFGPTVGKLVKNLEASGYRPEQVDEVYITHMHPDHVGGLVTGGRMTFANATVRAAQEDADYWLSKEKMDAAPKEAKDTFEDAVKAFAPYQAAGKFKPFEGNLELVPGVRAIAAHGHTPGHTAYLIESQGDRLLLWGDLMHIGAVQFPDPAVTIHFDGDSSAAAAARKTIFAEAAERREWVGGAHVSFPGLGHLRAAGTGYVFVPVNYSSFLLH